MAERDPTAAWNYHESTKHSLESLRASPHFLDWEIQPLPFKIYPGLDPLALPREQPTGTVAALDAISSANPETDDAVRPDLGTIARLLRFSAGVTRTVTYPNGREAYFRAAACTGALYHIDLYLVCGALAGLDPGVYHFAPHDFALRRLRPGDHRRTIVEATGGEPAVAAAPAILVCASTFWRNAWKYQARAYRHCFWDSGTILANLLAVAAADGMPVSVVLGFVDRALNHLLGLDAEREAALALVAVGHDPDTRPDPPPAAPPLALETAPLSRREVDYPAIRAAHSASSLDSAAEAQTWRAAALAAATEPGTVETGVPLRPLDAPPAEAIEDVIVRRGSTREFAPVAIGFEQLSTMLKRATQGIPADFLAAPTALLGDLYLIVNAVDGLPAGTYAYARGERVLVPLRAGDVRREAGFLDLGQELGADASVNFYLLTDLRAVLGRFGNRGYRAAQLEAAIVGGKLYLAAYALGLGASGLTFFDDAVTDFFSPHAAGKSVMFLTAAGKGRRRRPAASG